MGGGTFKGIRMLLRSNSENSEQCVSCDLTWQIALLRASGCSLHFLVRWYQQYRHHSLLKGRYCISWIRRSMAGTSGFFYGYVILVKQRWLSIAHPLCCRVDGWVCGWLDGWMALLSGESAQGFSCWRKYGLTTCLICLLYDIIIYTSFILQYRRDTNNHKYCIDLYIYSKYKGETSYFAF